MKTFFGLPFDPNELDTDDIRFELNKFDWQGTLMAITIGLCVAWVLIEYVIGADTLISWFE